MQTTPKHGFEFQIKNEIYKVLTALAYSITGGTA
jgi:hypothetical protein